MSQEHVRLLLAAREKIASKEEHYICVAVGLSTGAGIEIINQITLDMGVFPHTLSDRSSLEGWLRNECGRDPYGDNFKLRATRLAWIDALIEYWKDKP